MGPKQTSFDGELMASFAPVSWRKARMPDIFTCRDVTDVQKCGLEIHSLPAQHIQATEGIFDRHPFLRRAHVILLQFINAGLDCTLGLFDTMRQS